jgi:glutaminyl-peptide cyclotransferase
MATRRVLILLGALAACGGSAAPPKADTTTPSSGGGTVTYGVTVVHRWPHDPTAFTEGLEMHNGLLYEGTGIVGQSGVRVTDPATGTIARQVTLAPPYFGEGITVYRGTLYELTWTSHVGFRYDPVTLQRKGKFAFSGEGWGLTHDSTSLIMSDGTNVIRYLDPATLGVRRAMAVTSGGLPVMRLNELEWIKGEIWANIWQTPQIARIDPKTGNVTSWVDIADLVPSTSVGDTVDVANGIAYDSVADRIFVTGKRWPLLYEIKLGAPR